MAPRTSSKPGWLYERTCSTNSSLRINGPPMHPFAPSISPGSCMLIKIQSQKTRFYWGLPSSQTLIPHFYAMILGIHFSEYMQYRSALIHLSMSMYGMTLSSKYWYLALLEHLTLVNFTANANAPSLFIQEGRKSHKIYSYLTMWMICFSMAPVP
jgi:hypothetical protein